MASLQPPETRQLTTLCLRKLLYGVAGDSTLEGDGIELRAYVLDIDGVVADPSAGKKIDGAAAGLNYRITDDLIAWHLHRQVIVGGHVGSIGNRGRAGLALLPAGPSIKPV